MQDLAALDMGLKQLSARGAYGIYFEVQRLHLDALGAPDQSGEVYSDIAFTRARDA